MSSLPVIENLATPAYSRSQLITSKIRTKRDSTSVSYHIPLPSPFQTNKQDHGTYSSSSNAFLRSRRMGLYSFPNISTTVSCTMNVTEGDSATPRKLNFDHIIGEVKKGWESLPQPVRSFPWQDALENFLELTIGLVFAVTKYLSVPLLALTSLSEFSYCAHEKKMRFIPIPLLAGIVMADVMRDTTLELYPQAKEGEFPWHLIAVASFFVLLKFPGPYYPYWGRILIPHFANGGLLRSLWLSVMWYRNSPVAPDTGSPNDDHSQKTSDIGGV